MKRRQFIKNTTLGALTGLALTSKPAFAITKRTRWRMAMSFSKTSPVWGEAVQKFIKDVELLSSGALKIKLYGAGELVPALGTFDAVKKGDIQMAYSAAYYWLGKIPASVFFTSVPFGMTMNCMYSWLLHGGGQELWDELMQPHGLKCLPCGGAGYQTTGWYNKEIKTVADLKGLKIRIPGLAGKVYSRAGAATVLLPGGELFTGLATGVIDAVEWVGPYLDYQMGFHKAAKYYYGGSWHEPGSILEMMFNKNAFEQLPTELQRILEVTISDLDRRITTEFEAKAGEYLEKIKASGKVQLKEMPTDVLKELKKHSDQVVQEIAATSPLATKIYKSYSQFKKQYDTYQNWSEKAYYQAIKWS